MNKNKIHIDTLTPQVIEQYLQDKLTDAQRHQVEKLMLDSDFEAESMTGFENLKAEEIAGDLNHLENRLDQRIKVTKKSNLIYWRIAAAVSLLTLSGFVVFLLLKDTAPDTQLSQVKTPEEIVAPSDLTIEPEFFEETLEVPSQTEEEPRPVTESITDNVLQEEPAVEDSQTFIAEAEQDEEISEELEIEVKKIQDQIAARSQAAPASIQLPEKTLSGKVVSVDENKPLAGVNVVVKGTTAGTVTDIDGNFKIAIPQNADSTLVTSFIGLESQTIDVSGKEEIAVEMAPDVAQLSEVVVTRAKRSEKKASGYAPLEEGEKITTARAVIENYDKYLEENLQYPEGQNKSGEVIVAFLVNSDSTLSDFKIVKSLGEQFDQEAIRTIKEGPKWVPALENGEPISREVKIEVKFRKP